MLTKASSRENILPWVIVSPQTLATSSRIAHRILTFATFSTLSVIAARLRFFDSRGLALCPEIVWAKLKAL